MVLYRDDDVLVINKPAGLAVAPGPGRFGGGLYKLNSVDA
jgi:23S rRNA-/tRNA-specific pseudouridylate synthase